MDLLDLISGRKPIDLKKALSDYLDSGFDPTGQYAQFGMEAPTRKGDIASLGLDMAPGVGDVKSLVDALQAAGKGNFGEAALGALGGLPMIPAMGGALKYSKHPKFGKVAVDAAGEAIDATGVESPLMAEMLKRGGGKRPKMDEAGYLKIPGQSAWPAHTRQTFDGVRPTVVNPTSISKPGIYGDPRDIVAEAVSRVAPESQAMQDIFGVTNADLADIGRTRKGNADPFTAFTKSQGGNPHTTNVITPANTQRLVDILAEAGKHKGLADGMDGWYVMDPAYQMLEKEYGKEKAIQLYDRFNNLTGWASARSEVNDELLRGTTANYLAERGRFNEFLNHGSAVAGKRPDFTADWATTPGHAAHGAQSGGMDRYVRGIPGGTEVVKVPNYIKASGVPETGFQTSMPVADAHWSRAVGLGDVRPFKMKNDKLKRLEMEARGEVYIPERSPDLANATMGEMQILKPWWANEVAGQVGLESVPAQARLWGAVSGQTGVTSPIGTPKLGLLAELIKRKASATGQDPKRLAIEVLSGQQHLNF